LNGKSEDVGEKKTNMAHFGAPGKCSQYTNQQGKAMATYP